MKTLIVILVLFCSISAKAEKLEGIFGIKFLEVLTNELTDYPYKVGFDLNSILDTNNVDELSNIDLYKHYYYSINPRITNDMFNEYKVQITPLSKKIIKISASNKLVDKYLCKDLVDRTVDFFYDKYSSEYKISRLPIPKLVIAQLNNPDDKMSLDVNCSYSESNSRMSLSLEYTSKAYDLIMEENDIIKDSFYKRKNELTQSKLDTSGF